MCPARRISSNSPAISSFRRSDNSFSGDPLNSLLNTLARGHRAGLRTLLFPVPASYSLAVQFNASTRGPWVGVSSLIHLKKPETCPMWQRWDALQWFSSRAVGFARRCIKVALLPSLTGSVSAMHLVGDGVPSPAPGMQSLCFVFPAV